MWVYDTTITSEFYVKITQYLRGEISLSAFEDWFYCNLGDIIALPPSAELHLAGEIQLGLAEMSNGDMAEDQFRGNLKVFVERGTKFIISGSASIACTVSTGSGISNTVLIGNIIPDFSSMPVGAS